MLMASVGGGDLNPYFYPHLWRVFAGLGLALIIIALPLSFFLHVAYPVYAVGLIALVVVEVTGHMGMGAQRWIKLGGMTFQPSEMMKIATILALARYFHYRHMEDLPRLTIWIVPVLMVVLPAILILRQPNLGTATILLLTSCGVFFLAGLRWRYIVTIILLGLGSLPIGWQFLHDYQQQRVLTFLDPEKDPLGSGYNILQSIIAIGSGGAMGKGFLQGSQSQLDFLPEKHTDFIFTVLAEEWGFIGCLLVLGLYGLFYYSGLSIASRSQSRFGALVVGGIVTLIFVHMAINMAMVAGMIPVVGVPLPFLSFGGSMMLTTLVGVGLLINIYYSRTDKLKPTTFLS